MIIAFGSDHAGFKIRNGIIDYIESLGHRVMDFGTHSSASCDYPDFAADVAQSVSTGKCERGILMCGTGIGMSIAANKVKGVRAAVCWNKEVAKLASEHNNATVLCLSARFASPQELHEIIETWLKTPFTSEPRHLNRIGKISQLEDNMCRKGK